LDSWPHERLGGDARGVCPYVGSYHCPVESQYDALQDRCTKLDAGNMGYSIRPVRNHRAVGKQTHIPASKVLYILLWCVLVGLVLRSGVECWRKGCFDDGGIYGVSQYDNRTSAA